MRPWLSSRTPSRIVALSLSLWLAGCASSTIGDGPNGAADAGSVEPVDAPPGCGDEIVSPGETCDPPGSCPEDCPPIDSCTPQVLVGSADQCSAACEPQPITECVDDDGCCPETCDSLSDSDCPPVDIVNFYAGSYSARDLGPPPGVPSDCGAMFIDPADPDVLLIGGNADESGGGVFALQLVRDAAGIIVGFGGAATQRIDAPYVDSGLVRGPGGVTLVTTWPNNEIAVVAPGGGQSNKLIDLSVYGIASSPGGAQLVPSDMAGAGALKLISWPDGEWYTATVAWTSGSAALSDVQQRATLPGGALGVAYVPVNSPLFAARSIVVAEYSNGTLSVYDVDAAGDPITSSRRLFVEEADYPSGVTFDPTSGEMLFCTAGGTDRVVAVSGFYSPPEQ